MGDDLWQNDYYGYELPIDTGGYCSWDAPLDIGGDWQGPLLGGDWQDPGIGRGTTSGEIGTSCTAPDLSSLSPEARAWFEQNSGDVGAGSPTCTSYGQSPNFFDTSLGKTLTGGLAGLLGAYFNSKNAQDKATARQQIQSTVAKTMDPEMRARFMAALDKYESFIGGMPDPGMGQSAINLWEQAMQRVNQAGVMPQQEAARQMYLNKVMPYAEEAFDPYQHIGRISQQLQSPEYMTYAAQEALKNAGLGHSGLAERAVMEDVNKRNAALLQAAAGLEQGRSQIPLSISQTLGQYTEPLAQTYNPLQALQFADLPKKTKQADIAGTAQIFGDLSRQLAQGFPYTGTTGTNSTGTFQKEGVPSNWAADWLSNLFTQGGRAVADKQIGTTQAGQQAGRGLDFGGTIKDLIGGFRNLTGI